MGTWNMSGWRAVKAQTIFPEVGADVLALQETHLSAVPLHWAYASMKDINYQLHHGHPARASVGRDFGKSCGVGFAAGPGVALLPSLPCGPAGRWLHQQGRLHTVRLPPRRGLPRGLLLASVYAPLQLKQHTAERRKFVEAMIEFTHALDLQSPILLMGDFNGSPCPSRDFLAESGGRREPCPLLAQLLGPAGAWVDVHAALLGEPLPWTFQILDGEGKLSASRIDLILANHAALSLIERAWVLSDVRDGGHSPVLVDLCVEGPVSICWRAP